MEAVFEGSVAPQLIRGWGGMGGEQGLARDESNENLSLQMKKNDEGIESLHISGQFNEISRKVAELAEEKSSLLAQLKQGRVLRPQQASSLDASAQEHVPRFDCLAVPFPVGCGGGKENNTPVAELLQEQASRKASVRFSSPLLTPKSRAREEANSISPGAEQHEQQSTSSTGKATPVHDEATASFSSRCRTQEMEEAKERAMHAMTSLNVGDIPGGRWQMLLQQAEERAEGLAREVGKCKVVLQAKDMEVERLRGQVKTSEEHTAVILAELGASTRSLSDMRATIANRDAERAELEDLRSIIVGMKRDKETAKRNMSLLEEERTRDVASLRGRLSECERELDESNRRMTLESERARGAMALDEVLGGECRRLEAALLEAQARCKGLEEDLGAARDTCLDMEGSGAALQCQVAALLAERDSISASLSEREGQLANLAAEGISQAAMLVAERDAVLASLRSEMDARIDSITAERVTLLASLSSISGERDSLSASLSELSTEGAFQRQLVQELTDASRRAEQECIKLASCLTVAEKRADDESLRLQTLQSSAEATSRDCERMACDLACLKSQMDHLADRITEEVSLYPSISCQPQHLRMSGAKRTRPSATPSPPHHIFTGVSPVGFASSPSSGSAGADASRASTRLGGTPNPQTPGSPAFGAAVGGIVDLERKVEAVMEVGRARAAKLAEAERELQGEKERGTRLWGEISEERKKIEGLEVAVAEWEAAREGWEKERADMRSLTESWAEERESWEAEREGMEDEREKTMQEVDRWEGEREGWEEEREGWERERAKWRLGWDAHKKDADALRAALAEQSAAHSGLQTAADAAIAEAGHVSAQLQAVTTQLADERAKLTHARRGLAEAEGDRIALRDALAAVSAERDALSASLTSERAALRDRDTLLASSSSEKDSIIASLSDERHELIESLSREKDALSATEEECEELRDQIIGLMKAKDEAEERAERTQERAGRDAEAAKTGLLALQGEVEKEREAREDGWHKLVEARGEAEGWRIACSDKSKQLQAARDECDTLRARCDCLEGDAEGASRLAADNSRAISRLLELEEQLTQTNMALHDARETETRLRDQCTRAEVHAECDRNTGRSEKESLVRERDVALSCLSASTSERDRLIEQVSSLKAGLASAIEEAKSAKGEEYRHRAQLQEFELLLAQREAEAAAAMRAKEGQIVEFLKAVEAKAEKRDSDLERYRAKSNSLVKELGQTRAILSRTEDALAKVMRLHACASPFNAPSSVSSPSQASRGSSP